MIKGNWFHCPLSANPVITDILKLEKLDKGCWQLGALNEMLHLVTVVKFGKEKATGVVQPLWLYEVLDTS